MRDVQSKLRGRYGLFADSSLTCPENYDQERCKGFFTLIWGIPELAIAGARFALKNYIVAAEAKWRCSMDVAGRFARVKRTILVRAAVVDMLEELPFICPVAVAVGSTVMIVIKLFKDLPQ